MASGQQDQYANDPGSAGHPPPHDPSRYPGYPPQTPTTGGYPHEHPSSARSGSFPYDAMRQPYPQTPGSTSGNPAMSAVQSPTYPYYPSHDMGHYGAPGSAPPNYGPWPGYGQPGMAYSSPGAHSAVQSPASAGPPRGQQVYSFVPIPGAQQHKRPRRRYEEIERMYKCGYNGCEKAYGTLNHLNAHVTMQGHGSKRTPEEFKEIRKEWKARKKEEENQRKAEDERQRQASMSQSNSGQPGDNSTTGSTANSQTAPTPTTPGFPQSPRGPQLPPIGYNSTGNPYPGASGTAPDPSLYGNSQQGQNNYYSNYISHPEGGNTYAQ